MKLEEDPVTDVRVLLEQMQQRQAAARVLMARLMDRAHVAHMREEELIEGVTQVREHQQQIEVILQSLCRL